MKKNSIKAKLLFTPTLLGISLAVSFAEQSSIPAVRFDNPVRLSYGDPATIAPMKAADTDIDWTRSGRRGARWAGQYWEPDPENPLLMRHVGRGGFQGVSGDLAANDALDVVVVEGDRFVWYTDQSQAGNRKFVTDKKHFLPFVYGGDLRLPETFDRMPNSGERNAHLALADWDGDGLTDLVVSATFVGSSPYSDGVDSRYIPNHFAGADRGWMDGHWVFGDLKATVFWYKNVGTKAEPKFADARIILAGAEPRPVSFAEFRVVPTVIDWDNDGALDLVISTHDRMIVFLNTETDGEPRLDDGHRITFAGKPTIPVMKAGVPYRDQAGNLVIRFSGGSTMLEARPIQGDCKFSFGKPTDLMFENPLLTLDVFPVPQAIDWDGDGKLDILSGFQDGYVVWFRNLDPNGGVKKWDAPRYLEVEGHPLLINDHKVLQGPIENLWGYSAPMAVDWDMDGDLDLIVGNHTHHFAYFENVGTRTEPELADRGWLMMGDQPVFTAWRTRPAVFDVNADGLPDLIGQNENGQMVVWYRFKNSDGTLDLRPPELLRDSEGNPFQVSTTSRGSGRTVFSAVDWDGDGLTDIVASLYFASRSDFIGLYRNLGLVNGKPTFEFLPRAIEVRGMVKPGNFTHYRMLEPVDFDGDGHYEALAGEDHGWFHYWSKAEQITEDNKDQGTVGAQEVIKFSNTAPRPTITSAGAFGSVERLQSGAKVFLNREEVFSKLPEELENRRYLLSPQEMRFAVCEKPGIIYALVPRAQGLHREVTVGQMLGRGFEMTDIPEFQLFGTDPVNRVVVMQKKVAVGEKIVLGNWVILCF
jgi:hypothetical protein